MMRLPAIARSCLLAAAFATLIPAAGRGEFRHALVIGQSHGKSASSDTSVNSTAAVAVAAALERRGFSVTRTENVATVQDLDTAIKSFAQQIPTNGTALVYFAGPATKMVNSVGPNSPRTDIGMLTLDGAQYPLHALLGPLVMPQYAPFGPDGRARGLNEWFKQGRQSGSRINIVILDTVAPPAPALPISPVNSPANSPASPPAAAPPPPVPAELLQDSLLIVSSADLLNAVTTPASSLPTKALPATSQAATSQTPLADRLLAQLAGNQPLAEILGRLSPHTVTTLADGELARLAAPPSRSVSGPEQLAAGPSAGAEWVDRNGIVFCWCPPGEFTIGGPADDPDRQPDELPARVAFAAGYWMAKYELTYRDCLPLGSVFHHATGDHKLQPINNLFRQNFASFFKKLNETAPAGWQYGLPTEAEWQYAAQAGTTTAYSFGANPADLARFGNFADKSLRESQSFGELAKVWPPRGQAPQFGNRQTGLWNHAHAAWNDGAIGPCRVGSYPPNPWGLCDIHGNVSELTSTLHDPYRVAPVLSTAEMDEWLRRHENRWYFNGLVSKGGNWASLPSYCRSAFRGYERGSDAIIGMRLVLRPTATVLAPPPTRWTALPVSVFTATSGATSSPAADGTLLVAGPIVAGDTYTITCPVPAGIAPREIRLECLTDPTLPKSGPGRAASGGFSLAEVSIAGVRGLGPAIELEVLEVRSDHPEDKRSLIPRSASTSLVDHRPETFWSGLDGKSRELCLRIALPSSTGHDGARWRYPVTGDPRAPFTSLIVTVHNARSGATPLGKLRLSVLHEGEPAGRPEAAP